LALEAVLKGFRSGKTRVGIFGHSAFLRSLRAIDRQWAEAIALKLGQDGAAATFRRLHVGSGANSADGRSGSVTQLHEIGIAKLGLIVHDLSPLGISFHRFPA